MTGKPDDTKGESIIAFLVLKEGFSDSENLRKEVVAHIRSTLGPIATPDEVYFVSKLPKTRSGKIMRRLLKSIASGHKIGDVTTLEDEESLTRSDRHMKISRRWSILRTSKSLDRMG